MRTPLAFVLAGAAMTASLLFAADPDALPMLQQDLDWSRRWKCFC